MYCLSGEFESAKKHFLKCIEYLNSLELQNSVEMVAVLNNYANLHNTMGNSDKALEFLTYATELNEQILGNCHPDLLMSYLNLSSILIDHADYNKADLYLKKAAALIENYSYFDTTFAAVFHLNLGKFFLCQGQYPYAESHLEEALRLSQIHFGKIHQQTAHIFELLCKLSMEKKQYQKAINYGKESLSIHQLLLGEDNIILCSDYLNLGICHHALDQTSLAEDCYLDVISIASKNPDLADYLASSAFYYLGILYDSNSDYENALQSLCMSYLILLNTDADENEQTAVTQKIYDVYLESGRNASVYNEFITDYLTKLLSQ